MTLDAEEMLKIASSFKRKIGDSKGEPNSKSDEAKENNSSNIVSSEKELSGMFDDLLREVEEEQHLLARNEAEGNFELAKKLKSSISEKVSDMQKIVKLLGQIKNKKK